jgi:hypothetical protein
MNIRAGIFVTCAGLAAAAGAQTPSTLYNGTDVGGARFGATIGAGAAYRSPPVDANAGFGGKATLSCSGVDFNGFLNKFNPMELKNELASTVLNGAQAAVTNYVMMLAFSNPTIASVLDMMDQRFSARFNAFAEQCNAAQARARGESEGARQMSAAQDQCFSTKVQGGDSPTEAFRACAKASTIAALNLPAAEDLRSFLTKYSSVNVTQEVESLLGLLPDSKTTSSGVQARPPVATVSSAQGNVTDWAANALIAILNGTDPNTIPDCPAQVVNQPVASVADQCIPVSASAIVRSPAFMSARLLTEAEQKLYVAALSEQVGAVELRARLVLLRQELSRMTPKPDTQASADDVGARRDAVLKEVQKLESDAQALEAVTSAKAQMARTQILAMQRAAARVAAEQASASRSRLADNNGFVGGLRSMFGLQP